MHGIFVTGTDTGVGKTAVSAALLCRYRHKYEIGYWKPVQTGWPEDDDARTVRQLARCADREILDDGIRLPRPLSPHLAAQLSGRTITLDAILESARKANRQSKWVVEGAGGILVPLNEGILMAHLITRLELPALIVARSGLGTINHTLLTLEALRLRAIPIAGVVLVGEPNAPNRRAIEEYGCVEVIGEMPRFETLTQASLAQWVEVGLDRSGRLNAILEGPQHD